MAQVIENALASEVGNTTVAYSSLTKGFIITNGVTGEASTIEFAVAGEEGTDVSAMLGLRATQGGVISNGSDALTPAAIMTSIINQTKNWVSFTSVTAMTSDEILAYSAWNNSQNVSFLFSAYVEESSAEAIAV